MSDTAQHAARSAMPFRLPARGTDLAEASDVVRRAFEQDKRDALQLAVRARWVALALIAVLLLFLVPIREVIYYYVLLLGFAAIGWGQLKLGRVGHSRTELALLFCDLALMTFTLMYPNPLRDYDWPAAMQFRFNNFMYFYVLLAAATMAYSWRTVITVGTWTSALWLGGVAVVAFQPVAFPELTTRVHDALEGFVLIQQIMDPNSVRWEGRIQEIAVFLIVAGILAASGWRANRLLAGQAAVERERANLARYFSPNVVEELAQNDDPLKQVRTQNVAVMFVDIVGFTKLTDNDDPGRVIDLLREFHGRMEREVFRHNGTLDKYLGDGLMATFGTPLPGTSDAGNALRCAHGMIDAVAGWNKERKARGEPEVRAAVGIHYGPVVLGDIGANRLEFAVIGSTVNIASRLEALTREVDAPIVVSDAVIAQMRNEPDYSDDSIAGLTKKPPREIRGIAEPMEVWTVRAG